LRFAVIGSGISGLTAAWLLSDRHDVTVFEADSRLGGHTHTVNIDLEGRQHALDTGFIVYNERNYPNFSRLLARLGVATQPSDMSLSVRSDRTGWEYCGSSLNGLFAQRRNLARPAFYGMLAEIVRFNRRATELLRDETNSMTLLEYAQRERFSPCFWDNYLIPMAAAIWSAPPHRLPEFPARHFAQFCANHGLLSLTNRPQWRTVSGGAARYIEAMRHTRAFTVRLKSPVRRLMRLRDEVVVEAGSGASEGFDHVIVATHADQALSMLDEPSSAEREILGSFQFQRNEATLHCDTSLLPHRRRAWASWNYQVSAQEQASVKVTYWLNRLQKIDAGREFLVTLNDDGAIDPQCVFQRMTYHHPLITQESVAAQRRHGEISGQRRTHYCGAYWGYGFHEDGVNSAITVAEHFEDRSESCTVVSTKAESGTAVLAP
jgi:predicted NAD/FAD-binding protein